jgi:hypothetical protein
MSNKTLLHTYNVYAYSRVYKRVIFIQCAKIYQPEIMTKAWQEDLAIVISLLNPLLL